MRADRLLRVLFALQSRDRVTASELADELEVSVATARRDLESLAMSGVPIYPQRGRGGGWRLVGGARTNLTGLTEHETTALFSLLGQTHGGAEDAASAIRKLLAAVPATFRTGAQRAISSNVRDDGGWGDAPGPVPPELAVLQRAIAAARAVEIAYRDRDPVRLTPLGVAARGRVWYLLAQREDAEAAAVRMYRLDRMRSVTPLDEAASPPPGFELRTAWRAAVAEVEALRGTTSAEVWAASHAAPALLDAFGAQATKQDTAGSRVRIEVRAQSPAALAEQLAGWSNAIEVIGPREVHEALAALGARLLETYGGV